MMKYIMSFFLIFIFSCSLEEEILDEQRFDDLSEFEEIKYNVLAPPYGNFRRYFDATRAVLIPTDEAIATIKDPYVFLQIPEELIPLHQHRWTSTTKAITILWDYIQSGIALSNTAISVLSELQQSNQGNGIESLIAEVRLLKAYYEYQSLDFFRQVQFREPEDIEFDSPPQVMNAEDSFNNLIEEIESLLPLLKEKSGISLGRVNKDVANMLLAKLYLNAEVYIGTQHYQECIERCNEIISSERYQIEDDYFSMFGPNNNVDNSEGIFVMHQTENDGFVRGFITLRRSMHYDQNLGNPSWYGFNEFCVIPEFLYKWDQDNDPLNGIQSTDFRFQDLRTEEFTGTTIGVVLGPQYHPNGQPIMRFSEGLLDTQVSYTPEISDIRGASHVEGGRIIKYWLDSRTPWWVGHNNVMIFRYADLWLMKVEALFRTGKVSEALDMINVLREKRNAIPLSSLSLEDILDERLFELYWEGHRRQDLIRFERFTDSWTHKPQSEKYREVFPIPETALDVNPNLSQNLGY